MNRFRLPIVLGSMFFIAASAFAWDENDFFRPTDPLAARDEWGLLTPGPLNPTDYAHRQPFRSFYYLQSGRELIKDAAYVGVLQTCLHRKGYYNGPIDGVFYQDMTLALARFQKAHSLRVTGTLTVPVRRALHLP